MSRKKKKTVGKLFLYSVSNGFGLLMITPVLFMISTSFKTENQIWKYDIEWIPRPIILDNYHRVFTELPFGRFFLNSVIVAEV